MAKYLETIILMMELEGILIYKYVIFLSPGFKYPLEYNSWILNSVEYWIFFIVECFLQHNLRSESNFDLIY